MLTVWEVTVLHQS